MADQSDRPEPDFGDDPRKGEIADAGYPESAPEEVTPDAGGPAEREPDEGERTPAPSTSPDPEEGPGRATGNPRAAG